MEKFGIEPIKSLDTFGVAGALGRRSEVLYFPVFDAVSVGRLGDHLSNHLKPAEFDPFDLRNMLNEGIRWVYSVIDQEDAQQEPISVECGVDLEKVILGLSFKMRGDLEIQWEGLSERVFQGKFLSPFENTLAHLQMLSHRMILKYAPEFRLCELMFISALPGRIPQVVIQQKAPIELILLEAIPGKSYVGEERYFQLGDLVTENVALQKPERKPPARKKFQFRIGNLSSWKWVSWLSGQNQSSSTSEEKEKNEMSLNREEMLRQIELKSNRIIALESEIAFLKSKKLEANTDSELHTSLRPADASVAADYAVLKAQHQNMMRKFEELQIRNAELNAELTQRRETELKKAG